MDYNVMKKAFVYLDKGSAYHSALYLAKALKKSKYSVVFVDHSAFLAEGWEEKVSLLAFPGGRSLPYHAILQGRGNERIAGYIAKGGSYLGICAGGYYGAGMVEFEKGYPNEVITTHELAFFPGKAIGAAYGAGQFCYHSSKGARMAHIQWAEQECFSYFNGGCYFEAPEKYSGVTTIARYADLPHSPAAAIFCQKELGKVVLTGIHPEYLSAHSMVSILPEKYCANVKTSNQKRLLLWDSILDLL